MINLKERMTKSDYVELVERVRLKPNCIHLVDFDGEVHAGRVEIKDNTLYFEKWEQKKESES